MLDVGFRSITAFLRRDVRAGLAADAEARRSRPTRKCKHCELGWRRKRDTTQGSHARGKEFKISANTSVSLGAYKQLQVEDLQLLTADNLDIVNIVVATHSRHNTLSQAQPAQTS